MRALETARSTDTAMVSTALGEGSGCETPAELLSCIDEAALSRARSSGGGVRRIARIGRDSSDFLGDSGEGEVSAESEGATAEGSCTGAGAGGADLVIGGAAKPAIPPAPVRARVCGALGTGTKRAFNPSATPEMEGAASLRAGLETEAPEGVFFAGGSGGELFTVGGTRSGARGEGGATERESVPPSASVLGRGEGGRTSKRGCDSGFVGLVAGAVCEAGGAGAVCTAGGAGTTWGCPAPGAGADVGAAFVAEVEPEVGAFFKGASAPIFGRAVGALADSIGAPESELREAVIIGA